jgi:coenzyme Q-binding protein COQ10
VTEHAETRLVQCPADLMFQVVADVEKYPEFLPWVVALRVLSREPQDNGEILIAEMAVGYGALRERYTSRVTIDAATRSISVVAIKGPFKQLENHWRFTPVQSEEGGDTCEVSFTIAFQFANRLLSATADKAFEKVMWKMTDAFEARARALSQIPT